MATIRDVARAAGVSTATVSNVLNGRSDRVSDSTSQKVLSTVRALKYRVTPLENKQKAIQTQNIGFIVPNVAEAQFGAHGYFQDILSGVLEGAATRGYSLTVFVEKIWGDVGLSIRRKYDGRCDGIILVAPQPGNEAVEMFHARGTPLVLVGSTPWLPNVSSVDIDNVALGATAAKHFIELGHRRLAVAIGKGPQISAIERKNGFLAEAVRLGISAEQVLTIESDQESADSEAVSFWKKVSQMPELPTAVFCWHDGFAIDLLKEIEKSGLKVPVDISMIGVDDTAESKELGLTTFKNPTYNLGRRAARVLVDHLAENIETAESIRFAPEMVIRNSTARPG